MDFQEWTTSASDVITLHISNGSMSHTFAPDMTEYVFESNENVIIGYKEPKIDISFRGDDMQARVKISYRQKMKPDNPALDKLMDIEAQLRQYLPAPAFSQNESVQVGHGWSPPGEQLHAYESDGAQFEIWSATLADERAVSILDNMKILIPMYIEGGTVSFLDDAHVPKHSWTMERWRLFLQYQVQDGRYSLAGFATSYRLPGLASERDPIPAPAQLAADSSDECTNLDRLVDQAGDQSSSRSDRTSQSSWPANSLLSYPTRERISQFIILPPYQHSSHGIRLYDSMTSKFRSDPFVFEITIEDPNEHFDTLRDYCDLAQLSRDPDFSSLALPESIAASKLVPDAPVPLSDLLRPREIARILCIRHKLIKRQVQRLIELHLLHKIPPVHRSPARILRKAVTADLNDRKYYFLRLLLKQRIWTRNHEQLTLIDEADRIPKVESATDACIQQYQTLLDGFDTRVEVGWLNIQSHVATNGSASLTRHSAGKRRVVVLDDSDDSDGNVSSKRLATDELVGQFSR